MCDLTSFDAILCQIQNLSSPSSDSILVQIFDGYIFHFVLFKSLCEITNAKIIDL